MKIEHIYPVWFILCTVAGAIIGNFTGYGTVRGLTDGMMIAFSPLFIFGITYFLFMLWRPILPQCRCRQGNHKSYTYIETTEDSQAGRAVRFGCPRCGRIYEKIENRLNEITKDGISIPYMHHTKWGRWKETKATADDFAKRTDAGD